MARVLKGALAVWLLLGFGVGQAWAETVDAIRQVGASGSVGAVVSLTVTPTNISNDLPASAISFGSVSIGATPWVRAPQYLRVAHQSNSASWAIRILTNNRGDVPGLVGKILDDNGTPTNFDDDKLGYSGLIGSNPADPNNRVPLGWQVYKDPVIGGPAAPTDAQVGGAFNSPWAFLADASDCTSACTTASPVTVDKTIEFLRIAQGAAASGFLLLHPNDGNRIADGDIAVYLAGRFGGAPADTYNANIIIELYHF
jgi:hypothetical protein